MAVLAADKSQLTPSWWRWLLNRPFVFLMLFVPVTPGLAQTDDATLSPPFVSGFDRFSQHEEIDVVTAGRLLITELSCSACHATDDKVLTPKRGPVFDGVGSRVKSSWIRSFLLSPVTVVPGTTMPDMISELPQAERESAADAITAFLSSLQQPYAEVKGSGTNPVPMEFWNRGNSENGRRLYHQIGCVACHEPDPEYEATALRPSPLNDLLDQLDPDELREMGLSSAARKVHSQPLTDLSPKYTRQSLTYFLLNPEHARPAGRMPNFSLLAVDAADIAAWLLQDTPQSQDSSAMAKGPDAALIAHGRRLFSDLHCASCHSIKGVYSTPFARPLAELNPESNQTCLTSGLVVASFSGPQDAMPANLTAPTTRLTWTEDLATPRLVVAKPAGEPSGVSLDPRQQGQPRWMLDSTQVAALKATMRTLENPTASESAEALRFCLLQQNCYACHDRDQLGGIGRHRKLYFETIGNVDIGDEGRLPPTLTGAGNKLTTSWINSVLAGKGNIRPFMTIRMPVFPAEVTKPLPMLFASADGGLKKPRSEDAVLKQTDKKTLMEAGRKLMDTGCVQCHAFHGEALPGVIGVDLEGVAQRIDSTWLHDFLTDPGALKPGTRMPTFFPNGQSQIRDVFNGNVELQIAAMHVYLKELSNQPLPAKIQQARDQNYELTPVERPIVLRTFMPVAGTHTIAVGFPEHVHFAFDAENISLSQAWRGRFLDAEGTWFIRFAPPAEPLGEKLVSFPPGIAIAALPDKTSPWPNDAESAGAKFLGYQLDQLGVPTFRYSIQNFNVTDRIEPDQGNGLLRTIVIHPTAKASETTQVWFRAHAGRKLTQDSQRGCVDENGLTVTVEQPQNSNHIRVNTTGTEWIFPVAPDRETVVRSRYRWD